jgi:hypothetical protein
MIHVIHTLAWVAFLWVGCAAQTPVVNQAASGASPAGQEKLEDKITRLETSLSALRSEVAEVKEQLKSRPYRPLISTYKLPLAISLCGERIPLGDRKVREMLDQEFLVALGNEPQVLLWMKRARRYFPHIEKRLREMFLPDDLKYVTITESSLRPHAVSSSGAAGIWQFIPATGEKYGMRGSGGIDERFDFMKATEGALVYLKSLYEEFKSWPLALAAYNAGENRIRKEIALQRGTDYFYLDLPMETERYVYKITVAKIILSDPARYGFRLDEEDLYDPLRTDRIQIELPRPLPIIDVAVALGTSYKEIKEMNLHLAGEGIPAGTHFLNLPPGTSEKFWAFFSRWKTEEALR